MIRQVAHSLKSGKQAVAAMIAMFALIAGAVFFSGGVTGKDLLVAQKPIGAARLISSEPLPAPAGHGEMCEWVPASAGSSLFAALLEEEARPSSKAARSGDVAGPTDFSKRKPLRMIRDPYSVYSAVAVDVANNEVVLADENKFNVLAYDRLTNTPPRAAMSEPK